MDSKHILLPNLDTKKALQKSCKAYIFRWQRVWESLITTGFIATFLKKEAKKKQTPARS